MHIRTRNDLIDWLENHAPRPAIARAMQEGQIENFGAFEKIPPSFNPGWIVRVTSKFNTTWYIAIQEDFPHRGFITRILDKVPWKNWIGEFAKNKLYQGDDPRIYKELRGYEILYNL